MREWTELVLRHRKLVLAAWIVLFVLGGGGAANVSKLLSNQFSVPGSDSQRGLNLLRSRFHERSDGAFTLVAQPVSGRLPVAAVDAAARRAAGALKDGKAGPLQQAGNGVVYAQIQSAAGARTEADQRRQPRGAERDQRHRWAVRAPAHARPGRAGPEPGCGRHRPARRRLGSCRTGGGAATRRATAGRPGDRSLERDRAGVLVGGARA